MSQSVISGFRREVPEKCLLLSHYASSCGNFLPTFRDNLSVPSAGTLKMGSINLTFMGPCIANVFPSITNKIQCYTVRLFLRNALHVSGGSSAHHQELKNCIYSIGYFVTLLLLLFAVPSLPRQWQVAAKVWQSTRCYIYSFWAPDDRRRNRPKHVEYVTEINKLCNVAPCWLYLKIWDL